MKSCIKNMALLLIVVMLFNGVTAYAAMVQGTAVMETSNGKLDVEAEIMTYDDEYLAPAANSLLSDEKGLRVLSEDKTQPGVSDAAHLDASFKADKTGTYYVWMRHTASVYNQAGQNIFLSVNNGAYNVLMLTADPDAPKWMKLATVSVTAGSTASIRIRRRQMMSIVFDRFIITDDAGYVPTDAALGIVPTKPEDFVLTSTLPMIKEAINAFYGMTVKQVMDTTTISSTSTKVMYNRDATPAAETAMAEEGMYIRVTAPNGKSYLDYPLMYAAHRVGEISYLVDGLSTDGVYKNATLKADVTIDSYKSGVSRDYTLIVAEKKNGVLSNIQTKKVTVNATGSTPVSMTYPIPDGSNSSFQIYLWDDMSKQTPLKKSYVVSRRLAGNQLAVFGDSITGMNTQSYSYNIQKNTGMEAYNLGIGGAKMANVSSDAIRCFSMAEIVTGLTDPGYNWSAQQAYIPTSTDSTLTFHLNLMKQLQGKMSTIDYATVFYGTNDFTMGVKLDNAGNRKDVTTLGGATRYSIDKLLEANPAMQIILFAPMYRDRQNKTSDNPYIADGKDSDHYPNAAGVYLQEYGDKLREVAAEYPDNVYFYDSYTQTGINRYNQSNYFYDGLHPVGQPGSTGNILLGSKFSDAINRFFK